MTGERLEPSGGSFPPCAAQPALAARNKPSSLRPFAPAFCITVSTSLIHSVFYCLHFNHSINQSPSAPLFITIQLLFRKFFHIRPSIFRQTTALLDFPLLDFPLLDLPNSLLTPATFYFFRILLYAIHPSRLHLHVQDVWPARSTSRFHHRKPEEGQA